MSIDFRRVRGTALVSLACVAGFLISSCGGGGGGGDESASSAPPQTGYNFPVEPQDAEVDDQAAVTFTLRASTAFGEPSIVWYRNGVRVPLQQSATYTIPHATAALDNATIQAEATWNLGKVARTRVATLKVRPRGASVSTQPIDANVLVGGRATFSVMAGGSRPFDFQWFRNGASIAGATDAVYRTDPVSASDAEASYSVEVRNAASTVRSQAALLHVVPAGTQPVIVEAPQPVTVAAGTSAVFTARSTGPGPLHYQWLFDGFNIAGATEPVFAYQPAVGDLNGHHLSIAVSNATNRREAGDALVTITGAAIDFELIAGNLSGVGAIDARGPLASFNMPFGIARDNAGNVLVVDALNRRIRKIDLDRNVTTVAGGSLFDQQTNLPRDEIGTEARFSGPTLIAADRHRGFFISDNGCLRQLTMDDNLKTLAGASYCYPVDGVAHNDQFGPIASMNVDSQDALLYVGGGCSVRKRAADGTVSIVAGTTNCAGTQVDGVAAAAQFQSPAALVVDTDDSVWIFDRATGQVNIRHLTRDGQVQTVAHFAYTTTDFSKTLRAVSVGPGQILFVSDGVAYRFEASGAITAVPVVSDAETSTQVAAALSYVGGLTGDGAGGVYLTDSKTNLIRQLDADGTLHIIAGTRQTFESRDGPGLSAGFLGGNAPNTLTPLLKAMAVAADGTCYVAEGTAIRRIAPDRRVTTPFGRTAVPGDMDGTSAVARFTSVDALALDATGNVMYVADAGALRRVDLTAGTVSTVVARSAGTNLRGLAVDRAGVVYASDSEHLRVLRLAGQAWEVYASPVEATGIDVDAAGNVYVAGDRNVTRIAPDRTLRSFASSQYFLSQGSSLRIDSIGNAYLPRPNLHTVFRMRLDATGTTTALIGDSDRWGVVLDGTRRSEVYPVASGFDAAGNLYTLDAQGGITRLRASAVTANN
ncbi:hypothetical protein BH10PSE17_BH10PSE17_03400 [soil metagenome]